MLKQYQHVVELVYIDITCHDIMTYSINYTLYHTYRIRYQGAAV